MGLRNSSYTMRHIRRGLRIACRNMIERHRSQRTMQTVNDVHLARKERKTGPQCVDSFVSAFGGRLISLETPYYRSVCELNGRVNTECACGQTNSKSWEMWFWLNFQPLEHDQLRRPHLDGSPHTRRLRYSRAFALSKWELLSTANSIEGINFLNLCTS